MAASGAQQQLDKNSGYYQTLLGAEHDPKLVETIRTGHKISLICLFTLSLLAGETSVNAQNLEPVIVAQVLSNDLSINTNLLVGHFIKRLL